MEVTMKRKFSIARTGLVTGMLAAAISINVFAAQVNEESAKTVALENAGQTTETVTFISSVSDYEDGKLVYDVKFMTKDYQKYEYEINQADGFILSIEYDAGTSAQSSGNNSISLEKAQEIALNHARKKADEVVFIKTESEYKNRYTEYDMEFYTGDKIEYNYEINGSTGTIISWDYDAKKYQPSTTNTTINSSQSKAVSGIDSAKAAALNHAGLNASSGVIWGEVKTDYEDGRLVYEGEFFYSDLEYEFEIDATTGAVIDWDMESIYD